MSSEGVDTCHLAISAFLGDVKAFWMDGGIRRMHGAPFAPTSLLLSGRVAGGSSHSVPTHGVPQSAAETGRTLDPDRFAGSAQVSGGRR